MVYVDQNLVPVRLEMSRGPSFSIAIFIFIAIFEVLRKIWGIRLHIYLARALRALGLDKNNIQIFGSKLHIFVPSGQFEPHRSMFSTRKRCLIGSLIWGYQKFCSIPPKMDFWPKNGQIWPKIGIFGQILAFLAYLIPWPTKQWCKQVA